jgi:hypothetical protein
MLRNIQALQLLLHRNPDGCDRSLVALERVAVGLAGPYP